MRISSIWKVKSMGIRIMVGLVFAALIGSIYVTQALAKDDKHYGKKDNQSRYDDKGNKNNEGSYNNKGHKDDQRHYDNRNRRYGRYKYKGYDCYRIVNGRRIYQPCRDRGQQFIHHRG